MDMMDAMTIRGARERGAVRDAYIRPETGPAVRDAGSGAPSVRTDIVEIGGNAAYLERLRERLPGMRLSIGTAPVRGADRRSFTIDPRLIGKMRADPDAEAMYMERIRDIGRAAAWAAGISKSLGMETVWCSDYIDENGQLHHASISVRKGDGRSRPGAWEAVRDRTARIREKDPDAASKLERAFLRAEETGELRLDSEDLRWIGAAQRDDGDDETRDGGPAPEDGDPVPEKDGEGAENAGNASGKGRIGINAARIARQLAAAKTRSQVRAVIAELRQDLQECEDGAAQGLDVDEASVEAAERLLGQARSRLGQAEDREPTPAEDLASALASLM